MTKTIAQLWNGELGPGRYFGVGDPQMKQQWHLVCGDLKKIELALGEDQGALLEKFSTTLDRYLLISSEQAFCDGFCVGTKLAAEALVGAEKIL